MHAEKRGRCRGNMYVVVLMTTMVVTVIGIAALTASRIELRSATGANDLAGARICAQSAVEMALDTLRADPAWRTTYTHDTWVPDQSLGQGTFTWKLVDEANGDLEADPSIPVRLVGKGSLGQAVRMYSVLIEEPGGGTTNLISDPGFENGASAWDGFSCDIAEYTGDQHSGAACLAVANRLDFRAGPAQGMTDVVENGSAYEMEAWVKMFSSTSGVRFTMYTRDLFTGMRWFMDQSTSVGTGEWTKVTATLTPMWGGELDEAVVMITTVSGTDAFFVDDVSFQAAGATSDLKLIPGSWRREMGP